MVESCLTTAVGPPPVTLCRQAHHGHQGGQGSNAGPMHTQASRHMDAKSKPIVLVMSSQPLDACLALKPMSHYVDFTPLGPCDAPCVACVIEHGLV